MRRILRALRHRHQSILLRLSAACRALVPASQIRYPQKYIQTLRNIESCCGSLHNKRLLEIGCDTQGSFLRYLSSMRSLSCAVGVNTCLEVDTEHERFSLLKGDARQLQFPDNSFDIIASVSVFEHVQNLDVALKEMHRVLRPGGYLFAEFGPIWSSVWGHHLWFYHGNSVKDWRNTPLPPYAHLLMDEPELRDWCDGRYKDASLTRKICDFVYRSDEQNRLFYSDYEKIFNESPFKTTMMVGYADFPFRDGYEVEDAGKLMSRLEHACPGKSGFGYHCICVLLKKADSSGTFDDNV